MIERVDDARNKLKNASLNTWAKKQQITLTSDFQWSKASESTQKFCSFGDIKIIFYSKID